MFETSPKLKSAASSAAQAARNPWMGVIVALLGVLHARYGMLEQREVTAQLDKKAKAIGTTLDDNDRTLAAENAQLRDQLAALAAGTAQALRQDDAVSMADAASEVAPRDLAPPAPGPQRLADLARSVQANPPMRLKRPPRGQHRASVDRDSDGIGAALPEGDWLPAAPN